MKKVMCLLCLFLLGLSLFGCSDNNPISWTDDAKMMYKGETYSDLTDCYDIIFPKGELIEIGYAFNIFPFFNRYYVSSLDKECNIIYDSVFYKQTRDNFFLPNDEEKIAYIGIELSPGYLSEETENIDIAFFDLIDNVSFNSLFNRIDDEQFYRNPDTERYKLNIMCFGYEYMYIRYTLYYTDNEIFLETI